MFLQNLFSVASKFELVANPSPSVNVVISYIQHYKSQDQGNLKYSNSLTKSSISLGIAKIIY
jgi:hypothetical protein